MPGDACAVSAAPQRLIHPFPTHCHLAPLPKDADRRQPPLGDMPSGLIRSLGPSAAVRASIIYSRFKLMARKHSCSAFELRLAHQGSHQALLLQCSRYSPLGTWRGVEVREPGADPACTTPWRGVAALEPGAAPAAAACTMTWRGVAAREPGADNAAPACTAITLPAVAPVPGREPAILAACRSQAQKAQQD